MHGEAHPLELARALGFPFERTHLEQLRRHEVERGPAVGHAGARVGLPRGDGLHGGAGVDGDDGD